jgi:hypothetical protein
MVTRSINTAIKPNRNPTIVDLKKVNSEFPYVYGITINPQMPATHEAIRISL